MGEPFLNEIDKKLNSTFEPSIKIKLEENKIIFECQVPRSDVWISLHPRPTMSIHSYPLKPNRATVSALQIKLNFSPLHKMIHNRLDSLMNDQYLNGFQGSVERFFIYYHGKCRNCSFIQNSTDYIDLFARDTLKCPLKVIIIQFVIIKFNFFKILFYLKKKSCQVNGRCYDDREVYELSNNEISQVDPINVFICNSNYSQTSLYMPCAVNNGNCHLDQICKFNGRTLKVECI
jgi:hypothetical protein